jgi:hypothetical protein
MLTGCYWIASYLQESISTIVSIRLDIQHYAEGRCLFCTLDGVGTIVFTWGVVTVVF